LRGKAALHVGWLRRWGGRQGTNGWQRVATAPSEAEALREAERVRHAEEPWAGYCFCEWFALRAGENPRTAFRRKAGRAAR
jgi:hypothetical protein